MYYSTTAAEIMYAKAESYTPLHYISYLRAKCVDATLIEFHFFNQIKKIR